jgi:hypothetical protein
MMSHKALALSLDGGPLTSSVMTLVPLRLGSEEKTNGICNSNGIAKGKRVMMKLRAYCSICTTL